MATNIIDVLHADTSALLKQLGDQKEVSLQSFADGTLRKVLVLSAASWFETRICAAVRQFAVLHSNGHPGIEGIVRRKAIDRQYHTYFDWRGKKPGLFFALFGEECANQLKERVNADANMEGAVIAFLELGNLRNELVHENFVSFSFDKTADEVYALFQKAEQFVVFVESQLRDPELGRNSRPDRG